MVVPIIIPEQLSIAVGAERVISQSPYTSSRIGATGADVSFIITF
ncbi:hypothetical protein NU08_4275 [Flavobacterium anhuiense]|uniref:Uncharacterized protein n=1 Tax=Flavobacterium anhuiense TaxID=459526 RepID=A0A444VTJ8_9FLAO|nr:hypothetical protein NU08_4275 [Flavobacterium anhuiense]